MATYYIDPIDGNDANDGLSFANRKQKTFPSLSAGDEVRVIASPDPVSLGDADFEYDSNIITLSTPATVNLLERIFEGTVDAATDVFTCAGHSLSNDDRIFFIWDDFNVVQTTPYYVINATSDTFQISMTAGAAAFNVTSNGSWKAHYAFVPEANMLASGNGTYYRMYYGCSALQAMPTFTTGKMAYVPFYGGALDLSSYTHICLWFRTGTAWDPNNFTFSLCSDASGSTVVDTLELVTGSLGTYSIDVWYPLLFVKSGGGGLGSSLQSLAINTAADPGTIIFYLNNICACNDSCNLFTPIGKGVGDTPFEFYPVQFFDRDKVVLNGTSYGSQPGVNNNDTYAPYLGVTETATAYAQQCLSIPAAKMPTNYNQGIFVPTSGAPGNHVSLSGGWNRTDMSTQTGRTLINAWRYWGYGVFPNLNDNIDISLLDFIFSYNAVNTGTSGYGIEVSDCVAYSTYQGFIISINSSSNGTLYDATIVNNCSALGCAYGVVYGGAANVCPGVVMSGLKAWGGNDYGIYLASDHTIFENCEAYYCRDEGIYMQYCRENTVLRSAVIRGAGAGISLNACSHVTIVGCHVANCTEAFRFFDAPANNIYNTTFTGNMDIVNSNGGVVTVNTFVNSTIGDAPSLASPVSYLDSRYVFAFVDGNSDEHYILTDGATSMSDTTVRRGAPYSWKIALTDTTRNELYPFRHRVHGLLLPAGVAVTFSVWFRRDASTVQLYLTCPPSQLPGMSSVEIVSDALTATDMWQQRSVTVESTTTGFISLEVRCYDSAGPNNNGWWEGFSSDAPAPVDGSGGLYLLPGLGSAAPGGLLPQNWYVEGGLDNIHLGLIDKFATG